MSRTVRKKNAKFGYWLNITHKNRICNSWTEYVFKVPIEKLQYDDMWHVRSCHMDGHSRRATKGLKYESNRKRRMRERDYCKVEGWNKNPIIDDSFMRKLIWRYF